RRRGRLAAAAARRARSARGRGTAAIHSSGESIGRGNAAQADDQRRPGGRGVSQRRKIARRRLHARDARTRSMKIKDLAAIASAAASEPDMPDTKISRMEHRIERWGERLNPILVKEARQALKSRQFTVTFTLMLVAAWVWSILGI